MPRTGSRSRKRSFLFLKRRIAAPVIIPRVSPSPTRLQFPELNSPSDQVQAFGKSLVSLINPESIEKSPLLLKPTNRTAHAGGQRIKPGSPEEAALLSWIQQLKEMKGPELAKALRYKEEEASGAGHGGPPAVSVRRLTHSQYNNTVRDLLGDRTAPANQFPPEDFVNGFKNQYQAQSLSPLLVEAYSAAAEKLARNAFRGGNARRSDSLQAVRGVPRTVSCALSD